MITATIGKNGKEFTIIYEGGTDLEAVYQNAEQIARGKEVFNDGLQMLDLGPADEYDFIRVWAEPEIAGPDTPEDVYVSPFGDTPNPICQTFSTGSIEHLGNKVQLYGVKYSYKGTSYWLPIRINGNPACEVLKPKAQNEAMAEWLSILGKDPSEDVPLAAGYVLADEGEGQVFIEDWLHEKEEADERASKDGLAHRWEDDPEGGN